MLKHTHKRSLAFSGFLIYLLISQLPLSTLVMCVGGDGHLALEVVHEPADSSAPQRHGGPCLDFPVFLAGSDHHQALMINGAVLAGQRSPLPLDIASLVPRAVPAVSVWRLASPTLVLHSPSVYLRSVLLLI